MILGDKTMSQMAQALFDDEDLREIVQAKLQVLGKAFVDVVEDKDEEELDGIKALLLLKIFSDSMEMTILKSLVQLNGTKKVSEFLGCTEEDLEGVLEDE